MADRHDSDRLVHKGYSYNQMEIEIELIQNKLINRLMNLVMAHKCTAALPTSSPSEICRNKAFVGGEHL